MLGVGLNISSAAVSRATTAGSRAPFSNTKALSLDRGIGNYINTNYSSSTVFQDSFSVSWWMKPTDGQGQTQMIWGVQLAGSDLITFALGTLGTLGWSFYANSDLALGMTDAARFSDGAASDYKHYVFVVTKVTSGDTTYVLYENGSTVPTSLVAPSFFQVSDTNHSLFDHEGEDFIIGASKVTGSGAYSYLGGLMDEFVLWDTALSSDAANEIYNGGDPTDLTVDGTHFSASNVVLYYRFEDDVTDTVGTSDGTNNGATFSSTVPSS